MVVGPRAHAIRPAPCFKHKVFHRVTCQPFLLVSFKLVHFFNMLIPGESSGTSTVDFAYDFMAQPLVITKDWVPTITKHSVHKPVVPTYFHGLSGDIPSTQMMYFIATDLVPVSSTLIATVGVGVLTNGDTFLLWVLTLRSGS